MNFFDVSLFNSTWLSITGDVDVGNGGSRPNMSFIRTISMLVMDVGDEISWWQFYAKRCHQYLDPVAKIRKLSPTLSHQHHNVTNMTVAVYKFKILLAILFRLDMTNWNVINSWNCHQHILRRTSWFPIGLHDRLFNTGHKIGSSTEFPHMKQAWSSFLLILY